MTTGYPFMQLAARHRVDYGDVLLAADWCSGHQTDQTTQARNRLPGEVRTEINRLVLQPVGDRGGPQTCSDCGKPHFAAEPCVVVIDKIKMRPDYYPYIARSS